MQGGPATSPGGRRASLATGPPSSLPCRPTRRSRRGSPRPPPRWRFSIGLLRGHLVRGLAAQLGVVVSSPASSTTASPSPRTALHDGLVRPEPSRLLLCVQPATRRQPYGSLQLRADGLPEWRAARPPSMLASINSVRRSRAFEEHAIRVGLASPKPRLRLRSTGGLAQTPRSCGALLTSASKKLDARDRGPGDSPWGRREQ